MSVAIGLWQAVLGLWIRIGTHLFPPTIHPMLVHFPIVLLYLSLLAEILGLLLRPADRFFDRASFWLAALGLVAGVVAAAAGVISEQFVRWTPTTVRLLSAHQRDAVLTGFFLILALAARIATKYPRDRRAASNAWTLLGSGRGRSTVVSLVLLAGAVALITTTAAIGGTMVYHYGVGVKGLAFRNPARGA